MSLPPQPPYGRRDRADAVRGRGGPARRAAALHDVMIKAAGRGARPGVSSRDLGGRRVWRHVARLPVTATLLLTASAVALLSSSAVGRPLVAACCVVTTRQPALVMLARLPGSVLATATPLPVWGALAQIVIVVGVAEWLIGWRRTLLVGMAGHVLATVAGRMGVDSTGLLPHTVTTGGVRDTGPSVFVLTVAVYVVFRRLHPAAGWAVVAGIVVAGVVLPFRLAGAEHAVGALFAATVAVRERRGRRHPRRSDAVVALWAVQPRRGRVAGWALLSLGLVAVAVSQISPLQVTGTRTASAKLVAVHLRATVVPVSVDTAEPQGAFVATSKDCQHRARTRARRAYTWVWRRPVWLCLPAVNASAGVVVRYHTYGARRRVRVRLRVVPGRLSGQRRDGSALTPPAHRIPGLPVPCSPRESAGGVGSVCMRSTRPPAAAASRHAGLGAPGGRM